MCAKFKQKEELHKRQLLLKLILKKRKLVEALDCSVMKIVKVDFCADFFFSIVRDVSGVPD